ncbi:MAG: hypothetical protein AAF907_03665 [Planctomycetota bacterium]
MSVVRIFVDLGRSVRSEYVVWSTESWVQPAPPVSNAGQQTPATRVSTNDPKYGNTSRN